MAVVYGSVVFKSEDWDVLSVLFQFSPEWPLPCSCWARWGQSTLWPGSMGVLDQHSLLLEGGPVLSVGS